MNCEICKEEITIGMPVIREGSIMHDRFSAICFGCFFKRLLFTAKKIKKSYEGREIDAQLV